MLRAYTTYFITVVATNGTGFNSGDSDPVQHTTPQTSAAVAPSNISTTGQSSTVISVQWGGLSICTLVNGFIVRYRVQYSSQPNGTVQSIDQAVNQPGHWRNGADTSLTGLIPFTNYSIQVAAVNEDGEVGIFSDPITEQTQEDTPGPVVIKAVPSFFNLKIIWEEPAIPNGVVTDYEVVFWPTDSPESFNSTRTGLETSFTLMTVDQGLRTSFTLTVTAYTRAGAGEAAIIAVSTLKQPPAVEGVRVTSLNDTSVNVSWNALVIPDFSVDSYSVVYSPLSQQDGELTAVFPGTVTSSVISDLNPSYNYQFQVFATISVDGVPLNGEKSVPDTSVDCVNLDSECDSYMRSYSTIPLIVGTVVGGIGLLVDGTGFIAACIMVKKSRCRAVSFSNEAVVTKGNPAYCLSSQRPERSDTYCEILEHKLSETAPKEPDYF